MQVGKSGQPKSREATLDSSPRAYRIPTSPNRVLLSPSRRKVGQTSDGQQYSIISNAENAHSQTMGKRSLWPSISNATLAAHQKNAASTITTYPPESLADHIENEWLMDFAQRRPKDASPLTKKRSGSQFKNKELDQIKNEKKMAKEKSPFSVSMRYTGRHANSSSSSSSSSTALTPGRLSVDDYLLERRSYNSKKFSDSSIEIHSTESERSEAAFSSSTTINSSSFRKPTTHSIQSKAFGRPCKATPPDSDPNMNVSLAKSAMMKRANSLTAYGSSVSQWSLSPGRNQWPSLPGESFSSLRPSSVKAKSGMSNFLNLGLELFKGKRSSSSPKSTNYGVKAREAAHELRLLQNSLLQWRFANAKAKVVNKSKIIQSEISCANAWENLSKLQKSVMQKRIQLQEEKLEIKLISVLGCQMKYLRAWKEMERQHFYAVSNTKERLQQAICRVPLVDGSTADAEKLQVVLHHAGNLATSAYTNISNLHSKAQECSELMSSLAFVATRGKAVLDEGRELLGVINKLQVEERSLRCNIMLYT